MTGAEPGQSAAAVENELAYQAAAGPALVPKPDTDVTITFTPRQLAAGAAIIAGLILLVGTRHRRNRERRSPDEG